MGPCRRLIGFLVVLAAVSEPASGAALTPQERLSIQMARSASLLLQAEPLTVGAIDGAMFLLTKAAELSPDDPELWRAILKLAILAERDEPRRAAVRRIVKLDPRDEATRLLRLNDFIELRHTAKERIDVYQKLLSAENLKLIGRPVASRLAMDLARLQRSRGDVEAFGDWLAQATLLDPANRAAVATAAGFFRWNVEDPYGEAELLTSLMLADPTDVSTQITLAQLLLEQGASRGADRIYELASRNLRAAGGQPSSDLVADRAIAKWARGDPQAALGVIRRHQRDTDASHRLSISRARPDLSPLDLARLHAPWEPTLATVRAALHHRLEDEQAEPALGDCINTYQSAIDRAAAQETVDRVEVARLYLEMAWVAVWLGAEVDRVITFLEAADRFEPLSESASRRFDGWLAFRRGDLGKSVALLRPLAETDPAARLGLAAALHAQGNVGDTLRELETVARERPGTLIGVWASDRLAELAGRRAGTPAAASRLEELIASIPAVFDRYPTTPSLAVEIRATAAKPTFGPYAPVEVHLHITNNSPFPLAIDPDGPIRPQIALLPSVQTGREPVRRPIAPLIVDIDRHLRLDPHETILITVDLRRTEVGDVLNRYPLSGAIVRVKAVLNFVATPLGVIQPGLLGSEDETPPFRVDGVRITQMWAQEAIASIIKPDGPRDLGLMALLGHLATSTITDPGAGETARLVADAGPAVAEAFAQLDAVSQAWLLGVLPVGEAMEPILVMARKSEEKLVRISYLLYRLSGPDDPMLAAAKRGTDDEVRVIADVVETALKRQAEHNP